MTRSNTLPAARALALLRVAAGVLLVVGAARTMKFYAVAGILPVPVTALSWQLELPIRLSAWLGMHHSGPLAALVRDLLLPNGALVAGLLTWVELGAGLLLVLGLWTRVAGVLAAMVSGALVLAAGGVASAGGRSYLLLMMVLLACVLGDAGQLGGMDGWRRERSRDRNL
jgi:uncharacterized membrane protein YphA (DoxX/SURF4 family)